MKKMYLKRISALLISGGLVVSAASYALPPTPVRTPIFIIFKLSQEQYAQHHIDYGMQAVTVKFSSTQTIIPLGWGNNPPPNNPYSLPGVLPGHPLSYTYSIIKPTTPPKLNGTFTLNYTVESGHHTSNYQTVSGTLPITVSNGLFVPNSWHQTTSTPGGNINCYITAGNSTTSVPYPTLTFCCGWNGLAPGDCS